MSYYDFPKQNCSRGGWGKAHLTLELSHSLLKRKKYKNTVCSRNSRGTCKIGRKGVLKACGGIFPVLSFPDVSMVNQIFARS